VEDGAHHALVDQLGTRRMCGLLFVGAGGGGGLLKRARCAGGPLCPLTADRLTARLLPQTWMWHGT
jgi:hypothetical protein